MSTFNAKTTAEDVISKLEDRLTGKNGVPPYITSTSSSARLDLVVVTDVSPGGLGSEVVRSLAPHTNLIYVTGRNKNRYVVVSRCLHSDTNYAVSILQSVRSIKKDVPTANIIPLVVDLRFIWSILKAIRIWVKNATRFSLVDLGAYAFTCDTHTFAAFVVPMALVLPVLAKQELSEPLSNSLRQLQP